MKFYVCFEKTAINDFQVRFFEDVKSGRFGAVYTQAKDGVIQSLQEFYSTDVHELSPWLFNHLFNKYHRNVSFRGV